MKNNTQVNTNLIAESFRNLSELSTSLFKNSLENNYRILNDLGKGFLLDSQQYKPKKNDCCPPEPQCPPRCLLEIYREAYAGEFVIEPFLVKNNCNSTKTYQVGVRDFKDQEGNVVSIIANLNRNQVTLEPGQSIKVMLSINLFQGVSSGECFSTDIVIREKEVNQNICFKLFIKPMCELPTAVPLKEELYFNHWQSWQSHFYCETKPRSRYNQDFEMTI